MIMGYGEMLKEKTKKEREKELRELRARTKRRRKIWGEGGVMKRKK